MTGSISIVDIILVLISVCIFGAIYFPLYFKFGYMKTKIINMLIFMAMFLLPATAIDYVTKHANNNLVQKVNYILSISIDFYKNL